MMGKFIVCHEAPEYAGCETVAVHLGQLITAWLNWSHPPAVGDRGWSGVAAALNRPTLFMVLLGSNMPFAIVRKSPQQKEIGRLALAGHSKYDLEPLDRDALVKAVTD